MRLNTKLLLVALSIIMISSCSYNKKLVEIKSGGTREDTVIIERKEIHSTDGETFLNYAKNGVEKIDESNTINFTVTKKQKVKHKPTPPTISFDKNKYAYATIDKYFYKKKIWKPVVAVVGIAALVPTFGTSLTIVIDNWHAYDLKTYDREKIKDETTNCEVLAYNKKILLEVNVYCKNDRLEDTLIVTESLPYGTRLNSFKVKTKKGKISNVEHSMVVENGVEHHEYRIIGRSNVFERKKTKIWILEDVTISELENYSVN